MSALTRVFRELADEGADVAAATARWARERFADAADTPENVARIRGAISRAQPQVRQLPSQGANPFAVPVERAQRATQRRPAQRPLAARPAPAAATPLAAQPRAVPALPPPAEPLPSFAAKPRGGQWFPAQGGSGLSVFAPETVVEGLTPYGWQNSDRAPELRDWWSRALTRYLRNDFGTPEDPLRELASAAGLADSPEQWSGFARDAVINVPAGKMALPNPPIEGAHPLTSTAFAEERAAMPWLSRVPATDPIYLLRPDELPQGALRGLGYDFEEALRVGQDADAAADLNIPLDLAVRPESLQRMTFPQAVDRVGRIRQWRTAQQAAQEAERAASAQSNPALRTYREYAEDNPQGLRWMEIAAPEVPMPEGAIIRPVEGWDDMVEIVDPRTGMQLSVGATEQEARRLLAREEREQQLQEALTYEGDTMGHCVGNYCEDVLSGSTRIFSLRDPAGQPFVTVETRPRSQVFSDLVAHLGGDEAAAEDYLAQGFQARDAGVDNRSPLAHALELAGVPPTQDIIQIKGSGKRQGQQQLRLSSRGYEGGPDDYLLPFVQDFVRQGQFGNVGDLENTNLVRLPDARYITRQQFDEGFGRVRERHPGMNDPDFWYDVQDNPQAWEGYAPYFEGYAIGGRVDPQRCFTRHPLSVKR